MDSSIPIEDEPNQPPKTTEIHRSISLYRTFSTKLADSPLKINITTNLETLYKNFELSEQSTEPDKVIKRSNTRKESIPSLQKYENLFLIQKNSNRLIKNFLAEKSELLKSDAKGNDFSIKSILLRLKSGYTISKYNYKLKHRKPVHFKIEDSAIKLKYNSKCAKILPFDCVFGVIIGNSSATFKMHKSKIDKLNGKVHENYHCFSIVTDIRTYDFACTSDLARYDICLATSWLAYHYSQTHTSIPFDKCNFKVDSLTMSLIALKIKEIAKSKYMSTAELILVNNIQLAICKTLSQMGRDFEKIRNLLEKRYNYEGKIFRFINRSIVYIIREQEDINNLKNKVRIKLLAYSEFLNKEKALPNCSQLLKKKQKKIIESKVVYFPFFVPEGKYFEKSLRLKNSSRHSKNSFAKTSTLKNFKLN